MADFYGIEASSAQNAFFIAAGNSHFKHMKLMLADGVDINGRRADHKDTALTSAAYLNLRKVIVFLLDNGANIDAIGSQDMTALMRVCSAGKVKGSKNAMTLINAGADVNYVRVSDSMTALKFAAKQAYPEVLQALIDKGADVDGPRDTSQTALMLAARNNNVGALKVLIANGADPLIRCKLHWANNETALGLAKLEKQRNAVQFLSTL